MDFSKKPSRQSTFAYKWEKYKDTDILPMWIADTEFECAPAILDAMTTRVENGLFGYTLPAHATPSVDAIIRWCKKQYDWEIESDWVVWTPGVVPAFNVAIQAYSNPGDGVIVQTPNYPPLLAAPSINQRKKLEVGTLNIDGRMTLDFDALEKYASLPDTRLFIICNPMNPVGSVLTKSELDRVADICERHQVKLCSDEIHCDLILDDLTHLPASSHRQLKDNSITLMAASKTFNIAGLGTSFAIIPNKPLRAAFNKAARGIVPWVNVMGLVATEAAFTQCDDWHQGQLAYLKENRDYLVREINKIPGLKAMTPQATFLLWVDASGLGVENTQKWCEEKGVGPSPGIDFGEPNCFRLNFGCSRDYLEEAIVKLSS
ncbi:MalY/PatB family protein [Glaciecola sp. KUL10]|uniref:MalY/PatB family protein n=1 Tax=Glaciecola sp. (strain KUL10) TaxID=2161813 RepID=UPI000D78C2DE|nr:PatB family C-S lyase [Glaciecola sp. KUL10]GBL05083.1 aminotransferase [Glaciecola sp. KUL10]